MTTPEPEPQTPPKLTVSASFRAARRSLISTMEVYGINPTQAQIQVDNVISLARMLKETE
jgi:hypothetical protein